MMKEMDKKTNVPKTLQSVGGIFKQKQVVWLTVLLIAGVAAGASAAVYFDIYNGVHYIPTLFSGIPDMRQGFISCFSTYLIHTLVFLIPIYLFGMSAFGSAFIAITIFLKGFVCGIGALSYLYTGTLQAFAQSALQYTPALSVATFLTITFSLRAIAFSKSINNAVKNKKNEDAVNFRGYFSEMMTFLFAAVIACAMIAVLVWGCAAIFIR